MAPPSLLETGTGEERLRVLVATLPWGRERGGGREGGGGRGGEGGGGGETDHVNTHKHTLH